MMSRLDVDIGGNVLPCKGVSSGGRGGSGGTTTELYKHYEDYFHWCSIGYLYELVIFVDIEPITLPHMLVD